MFESGAWIIILESLVALAMAILIVWWTVPRQSSASHSEAAPEQAAAVQPGAAGRDSSAG
jgi:hypothetical protein